MKNHICKKYITTITLITIIIAMLITFSVTIHALDTVEITKSYDKQEHLLNLIEPSDTEYRVISEKIIYNSSNEAIYRYYKLSPIGFAIYNIDTENFEEISFYANECPFDKASKKQYYYFGPNNYAELDKAYGFIDLTTNERISNETISAISAIESRRNNLSISLSSLTNAENVSSPYVTLPEGTITYQDFITGVEYYESIVEGNMYYGTCTIAAMQLMLGYFDYYINDNMIADIYCSTNGYTEAFRDLLINYCYPADEGVTYPGAGIGFERATDGLNEYLDDTVALFDAECALGSSMDVFNSVRDTLEDYDVPLMGAYFSSRGAPGDHAVVIYGYQAYSNNGSTEIYYWIHNGGSSNDEIEVLNDTWFADSIYLTIP